MYLVIVAALSESRVRDAPTPMRPNDTHATSAAATTTAPQCQARPVNLIALGGGWTAGIYAVAFIKDCTHKRVTRGDDDVLRLRRRVGGRKKWFAKIAPKNTTTTTTTTTTR